MKTPLSGKRAGLSPQQKQRFEVIFSSLPIKSEKPEEEDYTSRPSQMGQYNMNHRDCWLLQCRTSFSSRMRGCSLGLHQSDL
ncbi:hypothetical protein MHYP_G00134250 [Metynnis hypsauchen]